MQENHFDTSNTVIFILSIIWRDQYFRVCADYELISDEEKKWPSALASCSVDKHLQI